MHAHRQAENIHMRKPDLLFRLSEKAKGQVSTAAPQTSHLARVKSRLKCKCTHKKEALDVRYTAQASHPIIWASLYSNHNSPMPRQEALAAW